MGLVVAAARVRPAWGYSVRYAGASAAQPALPLPPPSSVVGFYAEALARVLGLPEAGRHGRHGVAGVLASYTVAAGAGLDPRSPVGVAVYGDAGRVLSLVYQRKRREWEKYAWAVQSMGAAYAPSALLCLAIVVDVDGVAERLGAGVDEVLEALGAGGWRLGSKEGIVFVEWSGVVEAEALGGGWDGVFRSVLYQEAGLVEPLDYGYVEVSMWGLEALRGREGPVPTYKRFIVPASPSSTPSIIVPPPDAARFRVRGRGVVVYGARVGGLDLYLASTRGGGVG